MQAEKLLKTDKESVLWIRFCLTSGQKWLFKSIENVLKIPKVLQKLTFKVVFLVTEKGSCGVFFYIYIEIKFW